ncbi:MAG: T9SS type A sorting domain-containing protein, partial [Candidatus Sabulitectum sp.]|nr:T9SS type A sorting domain-containing protein [Candidatus Sabulitectum sp.]
FAHTGLYGPYHCLDATDESILWTAPYSQHGSSGIADGLLFFGELNPVAGSASVIALDCETGNLVWSYQTGINLEASHLFRLYSSPNPFVSEASISFNLTEPGFTSIDMFNLAGRAVSTLMNSELPAGEHSVQWDGTNLNGKPVSAGLYLCRIQSGGVTETTGLCLLR